MMRYPFHSSLLALCSAVVIAVGGFTIPDVSEARGPGKGSVARGGPAAGGSVRSRPATRPSRDVKSDRRDIKKERRDDVRDVKRERRDDVRDVKRERYEHRHDHHRERHEWYEDRWKRRTIGAALTIAAYSSLSCTRTEIIVGNITYYRCGNDWYQRAYRSTEVVYIVVEAPSDY